MNQKYDSLFEAPDTTSPDLLELLQQYAAEGRLGELFQPFGQEQAVLDQQMALAQGLRQPGPARGSPTGALLGGLSNAVGNVGGAMLQAKGLEGQTALGEHMQKDAVGRQEALIAALRRKKGEANERLVRGLKPPMFNDAAED